jgi:hypothetical protein
MAVTLAAWAHATDTDTAATTTNDNITALNDAGSFDARSPAISSQSRDRQLPPEMSICAATHPLAPLAYVAGGVLTALSTRGAPRRARGLAVLVMPSGLAIARRMLEWRLTGDATFLRLLVSLVPCYLLGACVGAVAERTSAAAAAGNVLTKAARPPTVSNVNDFK